MWAVALSTHVEMEHVVVVVQVKKVGEHFEIVVRDHGNRIAITIFEVIRTDDASLQYSAPNRLFQGVQQCFM